MANQANIKAKEEQVNALAEEFKNAKLVVLTDYRGITVADVTKLRRDLGEVEGTGYKVIKNNIVKRALNANGENGLDEILEGPTAVITSTEDYTAPLKAIYNYTKTHDFYKIKGGIVEGQVKTTEELIELAKLPSRLELISMLAGALKSSISKLAVGLAAVSEKKASEGPAEAAPVAEEAKTEEAPATEEAKAEEPAAAEEAKAEEPATEEKPAEEAATEAAEETPAE